jgi:uncharacterized membrane protein
MSIFRGGLVATVAAMFVATGAGAVRATPAVATPTPMIALAGLGGETRALAVNRRGQAMGTSYDAQGVAHAGVWLRPDHFTAMGTEPGFGNALNDEGHVVGAGTTVNGAGFLWAAGDLRYLTYPEHTVWPTAINNRDQVVGNLEPLVAGGSTAFLWQDGRYTLLPAPEGKYGYAVDISERGTVLGYVVTPDWSVIRAVVWHDGVRTDLGTLGGPDSRPQKINARDQVIGLSDVAGSDLAHPFRWTRGAMTDLLAGQPETMGFARTLNDHGAVVGDVDTRAVLWPHGGMRCLTPAGYAGRGTAINNRGEVAGTVESLNPDGTPGRVFRWRAGRLTYIVPPEGTSAAGVVGLDEQGRIFGHLRRAGEPPHAVIWLPR